MYGKRKFTATDLPTDLREFIARLAGPLEARWISRSTFCDVLSNAGISVSKEDLDRLVDVP